MGKKKAIALATPIHVRYIRCKCLSAGMDASSSVILIPLPLLVLLLALLIHLISCHNGYSINDSHLGEGGKSNEAEQKLKMAKY